MTTASHTGQVCVSQHNLCPTYHARHVSHAVFGHNAATGVSYMGMHMRSSACCKRNAQARPSRVLLHQCLELVALRADELFDLLAILPHLRARNVTSVASHVWAAGRCAPHVQRLPGCCCHSCRCPDTTPAAATAFTFATHLEGGHRRHAAVASHVLRAQGGGAAARQCSTQAVHASSAEQSPPMHAADAAGTKGHAAAPN